MLASEERTQEFVFCHAQDVSRVSSSVVIGFAEIADGSDHGGSLIGVVDTIGGSSIQLGDGDGDRGRCVVASEGLAFLGRGGGCNNVIAFILGDAREVATGLEVVFVGLEAHGECVFGEREVEFCLELAKSE